VPDRQFMRIATVVGARPQFIKAAALSRAMAAHNAAHPDHPIHEAMIHSGQHYDYEMSAVFFAELGLPEPVHHLGVGSGPHGAQTGEMLKRLEASLQQTQPYLVLVYGDTNTTLAGALAAAKLQIPVAHVEAGLRSFNRRMPEEINRVVTDHLATWLFCPSDEAVRNLSHEGVETGVYRVGDVMYDVFLWYSQRAAGDRRMLSRLGLAPGGYALATVHRAESTDNPDKLQSIVRALETLADRTRVVLPMHPRTRAAIAALDIALKRVDVLPPTSYEEMLALEAHAAVILTDSGGVQKEAYWLGVPCVTLRDETEWVETVQTGWNVLVGSGSEMIVRTVHSFVPAEPRPALYGDGCVAARCVDLMD
jgi:UDP-GlcNAc3NAcA epimerase